jgi:hypothetical protein
MPLYRKELVSPVYTIDRIYKSMQGPASSIEFSMDTDGEPELLWVVGYSARMTNADGTASMSNEFMCHSNMGLRGNTYHQTFPTELRVKGRRLFALDQGTLEIEFPEGFGIPLMSDQQLIFNAQVLNHNVKGETFELRQRVAIDFIRDQDLEDSLTPLVQHGTFGLVLLNGPDGHYGVPPGEGSAAKHGEGCSLASDALKDRGRRRLSDGKGREFSGFWVVPPGRHAYHTRITPRLGLPYDTSIHYVSSHLHPFAESLELRDITAENTVFKSNAHQAKKGIGLDRVETFSSVKGLPMFKDHEYELIAIYDNTSGEDQDAMATMFLYMQAPDLLPRMSRAATTAK